MAADQSCGYDIKSKPRVQIGLFYFTIHTCLFLPLTRVAQRCNMLPIIAIGDINPPTRLHQSTRNYQPYLTFEPPSDGYSNKLFHLCLKANLVSYLLPITFPKYCYSSFASVSNFFPSSWGVNFVERSHLKIKRCTYHITELKPRPYVRQSHTCIKWGYGRARESVGS